MVRKALGPPEALHVDTVGELQVLLLSFSLQTPQIASFLLSHIESLSLLFATLSVGVGRSNHVAPSGDLENERVSLAVLDAGKSHIRVPAARFLARALVPPCGPGSAVAPV